MTSYENIIRERIKEAIPKAGLIRMFQDPESSGGNGYVKFVFDYPNDATFNLAALSDVVDLSHMELRVVDLNEVDFTFPIREDFNPF